MFDLPNLYNTILNIYKSDSKNCIVWKEWENEPPFGELSMSAKIMYFSEPVAETIKKIMSSFENLHSDFELVHAVTVEFPDKAKFVSYTIKYVPERKYIFMDSITYNNTQMTIYHRDNYKDIYGSGDTKENNLLICEDENVLSRLGSKSSYHPTSVKELGFFFHHNQQILTLFDSLLFSSPGLFTDCIRENAFLPIPLQKVADYHSKRDYLEKLFKVELPKSINSMSFDKAYAYCCMLKYIKETDRAKLYQRVKNVDFTVQTSLSTRKRKKISLEVFTKLFKSEIKNDAKREYYSRYIYDYFNMAIGRKRLVVFSCGLKKFIKLHDELALSYGYEELKGNELKLYIPETPLKYLSLPQEFELITSPERLFKEGYDQHNCVFSYLKRICDGECVIYHLDYNNERVTIEVNYDWYTKTCEVCQCSKTYNMACSKETIEYIKSCVASASPTAIKDYKRNLKAKTHAPSQI